jgi:hypothetical protein
VEDLDPALRANYVSCAALQHHAVVTDNALQVIRDDGDGDSIGLWLAILDGEYLLDWDRERKTVTIQDFHMHYLCYRARRLPSD